MRPLLDLLDFLHRCFEWFMKPLDDYSREKESDPEEASRDAW